jgi:hypothetical protein
MLRERFRLVSSRGDKKIIVWASLSLWRELGDLGYSNPN